MCDEWLQNLQLYHDKRSDKTEIQHEYVMYNSMDFRAL